jgi:hypothetical protein
MPTHVIALPCKGQTKARPRPHSQVHAQPAGAGVHPALTDHNAVKEDRSMGAWVDWISRERNISINYVNDTRWVVAAWLPSPCTFLCNILNVDGMHAIYVFFKL